MKFFFSFIIFFGHWLICELYSKWPLEMKQHNRIESKRMVFLKDSNKIRKKNCESVAGTVLSTPFSCASM